MGRLMDGRSDFFVRSTTDISPNAYAYNGRDFSGVAPSETELQRELNQSGIVARRNHSTEIAGTGDAADSIDAASGRNHGVQIADWIGKVDMIEKIEELGVELKVAGFANWKAFYD